MEEKTLECVESIERELTAMLKIKVMASNVESPKRVFSLPPRILVQCPQVNSR
jgi:hypothetical protein